jgi:ribose transport system permease protein
LAARLSVGYPHAGETFVLDPIVATVLGGTRFGGGNAAVVGTIGACLLLATMNNTLNIMEVSPYVQQLMKGVVITLSIVLYSKRRVI